MLGVRTSTHGLEGEHNSAYNTSLWLPISMSFLRSKYYTSLGPNVLIHYRINSKSKLSPKYYLSHIGIYLELYFLIMGKKLSQAAYQVSLMIPQCNIWISTEYIFLFQQREIRNKIGVICVRLVHNLSRQMLLDFKTREYFLPSCFVQ